MSIDLEAKPTRNAIDLAGLRLGTFAVIQRHGLRKAGWCWVVECVKCKERASRLGSQITAGRRLRCAACGSERPLTDTQLGKVCRRRVAASAGNPRRAPSSLRTLYRKLDTLEGEVEELKRQVRRLDAALEAVLAGDS